MDLPLSLNMLTKDRLINSLTIRSFILKNNVCLPYPRNSSKAETLSYTPLDFLLQT